MQTFPNSRIITLLTSIVVVSIFFLIFQYFHPSSKTMMSNTPADHQQSLIASELAPQLEMGVVSLNVRDLEQQLVFYQDLVGLELISATENNLVLGYENRAVIELISTPELSSAPVGSAGLYHTAIVFESRSTLAQAVDRILSQAPARYSGTSDHIVSEAFYFTDPENNGVELYFDKDASSWQWQDGKIVMGSSYIDPNEYIQAHSQTSSTPAKKTGHVHLKVGDVSQARSFYAEVLGFYLTSEMPTALFMSDGFYHHHLGMNTWESSGAGTRSMSLGLKSLELFLPDTSSLELLKERLNQSNTSFQEHPDGVQLDDPWGSTLIFTVKADVF